MSLPGVTDPACSSDTADAFYSDNPFEQQRALRLCARCPVRAACRELGANEPFGIWGGLTPAERGFTKVRKEPAASAAFRRVGLSPTTRRFRFMTSLVRPNRTQAWFPGRYVPVRLIQGVEVFPRRRGRVRVGTTTIHGSTAQLRALAAEIMRAADEADAAPSATAVAARPA